MIEKLGQLAANRVSPRALRAQAADVWELIRRWLLRLLLPILVGRDLYNRDGLITVHRHAFMDDPEFRSAYQRGIQATGNKTDPYLFQWRVHIALWAAAGASRLEGDFVECGVNKGFMSSAVMQFLDWDRLGKTFYLLDTFGGIDPRFITDVERESKILEKNRDLLRTGFYVESADAARANFAQWHNHRVIVGAVPDTLAQVDAHAVAFLHIDMNCAPPEVAALRYFWPLLTPGGFVLFDDYAHKGYEEQRVALDAAAHELGVEVCALPTGQGLIVRPPKA